jgi:cation transporter-like permease
MNILIYSLIISVIIYLLLRFIGNVSAKKLTRGVRFSIFIIFIILALLLAAGGRFLLSFPLVLLSLALVKLKGLSLFP